MREADGRQLHTRVKGRQVLERRIRALLVAVHRFGRCRAPRMRTDGGRLTPSTDSPQCSSATRLRLEWTTHRPWAERDDLGCLLGERRWAIEDPGVDGPDRSTLRTPQKPSSAAQLLEDLDRHAAALGTGHSYQLGTVHQECSLEFGRSDLAGGRNTKQVASHAPCRGVERDAPASIGAPAPQGYDRAPAMPAWSCADTRRVGNRDARTGMDWRSLVW
jgi:hypothetical protein